MVPSAGVVENEEQNRSYSQRYDQQVAQEVNVESGQSSVILQEVLLDFKREAVC